MPDDLDEVVAPVGRTCPSRRPSVRRLQIWCHPVDGRRVVISLCGVFWVARKVVGLI